VSTGERVEVGPEDVRRAWRAGEGLVVRTPVLSSRTLGRRGGCTVVLKAENLQRTGSFKLRGAIAKVVALREAAAAGVVAGSAGNHAQALAMAASSRGIPCEVFMPADAPIAKAEAAAELGARVRLGGASVDDCLAAARERAEETGMALVHPFDDPEVVAGQGGVGLELLEDVPDLARVVVPLGGGGLASGVAVAVKSARPEVEVIGIQAAACAAWPESLRLATPAAVAAAPTIADGIAVKRPGRLTLALVSRWLDDVLTVGEDEVAEAMILLLERAKLVVEGAGAVGVAALLAGVLPPAPPGSTALVLSGGNVDPGLLASITRRHETEVGRRLVLLTRVVDRPGELARLLACVGEAGANLVDVEHVREGIGLGVRQSAVQLVLETRGQDHAREVIAAVGAAGYEARVLR
jgi:threonine dehydratase